MTRTDDGYSLVIVCLRMIIPSYWTKVIMIVVVQVSSDLLPSRPLRPEHPQQGYHRRHLADGGLRVRRSAHGGRVQTLQVRPQVRASDTQQSLSTGW